MCGAGGQVTLSTCLCFRTLAEGLLHFSYLRGKHLSWERRELQFRALARLSDASRLLWKPRLGSDGAICDDILIDTGSGASVARGKGQFLGPTTHAFVAVECVASRGWWTESRASSRKESL